MIGHPIPHTPAAAPCPFCGSDEWVFINVEAGAAGTEHGEVPAFRAECVECGTEGPIATTTLQAAQLWNRWAQKPVGLTRLPRRQ